MLSPPDPAAKKTPGPGSTSPTGADHALVKTQNPSWKALVLTFIWLARTSPPTRILCLPRIMSNESEIVKTLVPPVKATGLAQTFVSRGAAFGDLFNDGKVDVVINQLDGPPVLLRNVTHPANHWLGLRLIGGPKAPRDAVGATVYLNSGGIRQRRDVLSGGSFASSNDPRLHFGLGSSTAVESIEIQWPDGSIQKSGIPAGVDRFYIIEEGKQPLPGL